MALNALVDIFATIRKSVGLKGLRHPTVMFTVKPFNSAALKVGDFACFILPYPVLFWRIKTIQFEIL